MHTVQNKKLVQDIFAGLAHGDGRLFMESLSDDFCWTIIGNTSWAGTYNSKVEVQEKLLAPLFKLFGGDFFHIAKHIIAEGDLVVVEGELNFKSKSGKSFKNSYCWICHVSDGKLRRISEYGGWIGRA
jgi:ketosteroid isomerase-like protein